MEAEQEQGTVTECPIENAVGLLSTKWMIPILRELTVGWRRPSDIRRNLSGVSYKILSERLRVLEARKLVVRTVFPTVPLRVEYTLTPDGVELAALLGTLRQLGESWMAQAVAPASSGRNPCARCLEPGSQCALRPGCQRSLRRAPGTGPVAADRQPPPPKGS